MTSPHHLHATAAAWSLQAARRRLAELALQEARRNAHGLLDAAPVLRSSSAYGIRHGVGGHGDPTSSLLLLASRPTRDTTWADLDQRLSGKLDWLAGQLDHRSPDAAFGMDPIARILAMMPKVQPGTARIVARHLADEDAWAREAIRQPRPAQPLTGVPCPHCGERQLVVQTAGPVDAWTVVCATGRLCVGQGCPCGMPGAVEGAAHIWPRDAVIGAVAGDAPSSAE
ncbi:hypothetical protein ABZ793_06105 [Micromonospora sp. NPDC047465]|uniref:hypothetical protein n=1 Tax=Micromonospora sp. NPDC047465 TaxID=3154813 RepID=UPI0033F5963F